MAMLKVIELLAQSDKGWEDAAQKAASEAAKTVDNIKSVYIDNFHAKVENGRITQYRVNAKVSFELKGKQ